MKTNISLLLGLLAGVLAANAQTVVVAMRVGYENQPVEVPVSANGTPGIAAMACRASFDTASLDVTATSTFFGTFAEQYQQSGVAEPAVLEATIGGETFDAPFLTRSDPIGLGIAGARRPPSTDPAPVLFTLHVSLKSGAAPGLYPITLESAVAMNPDAGYPPGGEAVPLLVGYDPDTGVYPTLLDIVPGNDPVVDGSARFYPADTDGDGLGDAWELRYYPDLATADASTDTDHDGLSDLLEQLLASNPLVANGNLVLAVSPSGGMFRIRFPLLDNTALIVEASEDALAWSADEITLTPRPDLGSGPDWSMEEAAVPTHGRSRLLMRVAGNPLPVAPPP